MIPKNPYTGYRDQLATLNNSGKRKWVYAQQPKGKLYNYRNIVSYVLLILLFTTPFVKLNGKPLLLFNILERKFIIFGVQFWPQDFHLFLYSMITIFVFVVLFTVSYGRVWCGWTCPQTIFMEFIFRKIEYFIEGSPAQQRKLDSQPMSFTKFWKKALKLLVFYVICFLITNAFLSYIIGIDQLIEIMKAPISEHRVGFSIAVMFSGVMFFVFTKLREQVCSMICPYGRLQGVLLDSNSIVVAYDYKRGEERAPLEAGEDRETEGKGDCIDCYQCVDVCPTGIDVRDGTQLECINCTACIDECNSVMDWIGKSRGLIRFDSEKNIAEGTQVKWPARKVAYTLVLCILLCVVATLFASRSELEAIILRTPGLLYQQQDNNKISNMYNFKVVNKTTNQFSIYFKIMNLKGEIKVIGEELNADANSIKEGVFFAILPYSEVKSDNTPVVIGVFAGQKLIEEVELTFVAPN